MNCKSLSLVILLFANGLIHGNAQESKLEVGARSNFGDLSNYELDTKDGLRSTSSIDSDNKKTLSGDLTINMIKVSGVFYGVRVGMFSSNIQGTREMFRNGNRIRFIQAKEESNAFRLGIALGKDHQLFEKLYLNVGTEILTEFYLKNNDLEKVDHFDSNGNLEYSESWETEEVKPIRGRLNLFSSLYYDLWKSLSLGFQVHNGLAYFHQNGSAQISYKKNDSSNNLIEERVGEESININRLYYSGFQVYLGVKYRF